MLKRILVAARQFLIRKQSSFVIVRTRNAFLCRTASTNKMHIQLVRHNGTISSNEIQ